MSREHRKSERIPCELIASCAPAMGGAEQVWKGKVVDISRGGLLVAVGRQFEVGAILRVCIMRQDSGSMLTLLARVAHVRLEPDGEWLLGCHLAKGFHEVDLQSMLHDSSSSHD